MKRGQPITIFRQWLSFIQNVYFCFYLLSGQYFVLKIQVHFRLDFIMEANTINPDQTADLGSCCLHNGYH